MVDHCYYQSEMLSWVVDLGVLLFKNRKDCGGGRIGGMNFVMKMQNFTSTFL